MSFMGTLAKVAIGVMAAKGVGSLMNKSGGTAQAQGGGIQGLMSGLLGGGGGAQGGGLGGLMEQLGGGKGGSGGGLDDMLGGLLGGGAGAGGIQGMLGGLMGGAKPAAERGGSFGEVLNQSFARMGEPEIAPSPEQDAAAGLMLRAMIQAAKSDGRIDEGEKAKILDNLGDISPEEMEFVNAQLVARVDIEGLARDVPRGLEQQIYAMSVMAIDLDSAKEAQYLDALAKAMDLGPHDVNAVHANLGVPALYT